MFEQKFTKKDVEIIDCATVYQDYYRIDKYQLRYRLFAGGWSKVITREVFERGQAAGVLLFDPVLNKVVLIEQLRVGIISKTDKLWLLELVAGVIESGENAQGVAIREAQEEAGFNISDLIPISEFWVSPGASSEKVTLFCARVDASQAQVSGIFGLAEEGEDIRVHVFDVQAAYKMLEQGRITNVQLIVALQWLQLHEDKVKKQWQV